MVHLPTLISDLALILILAGLVTLLFKWLKQPLVLGYIVAGIMAGPYLDMFPTVVDKVNIATWAEIGVIFLLFALGLEFSFKKLVNVGASALITATTEVLSMLVIGFFVGRMLGWNAMNSIFLGGMLSMSSTTIIIKAFDDLHLRSQKFTGIVFGTLVVEDLIAILMMVLLSTVAASQQFSGMEMIYSLLELLFFLILWFLVGIYLLPTIFRKVHNILNNEMLLVISLGLCLGMVVVATKTGFSAALGAFIMGSILAETVEGAKIEHLISGIKDLFGAVFFVSVGMMVDPAVLVEYALPVLVITVVTLVCKSLFSSLGVLLSGQSLKISIQSGFSLAQIGEFAFIIASLGVSLGVMAEYVYPIIVAVSVITTFTTPYFIRLSEPFINWLTPHVPEKMARFLERNASGLSTVNHVNDWHQLLKRIFGRGIIYAVLIVAVIWLVFGYLHPFLAQSLRPDFVNIICALVALVGISPFLKFMVFNKENIELTQKLWNAKRFNHGALISLVIFQIGLAISFILAVVMKAFDLTHWVGVVVSFSILLGIYVSKRVLRRYVRIEEHFLANLNQSKDEDTPNRRLTDIFSKKMIDRDIHLTSVPISSDSIFAGKTLFELQLRKVYGVNVVKISRGNEEISIPNGEVRIFPCDELIVLGTDAQTERFIQDNSLPAKKEQEKKEISLESFVVEPDSILCGKTIVNSGIKERAECMVVGIERACCSVMNPDINVQLEKDDLVWVVGEKSKLMELLMMKTSDNQEESL